MPTTLITGASSGIGREFARLFAAAGHTLVLAARDEESLSSLAHELKTGTGTTSIVAAGDLADPASPDKLFELCRTKGLTVDHLVNNAGFATHGAAATTDLHTELRVIQVNVASLVHLTKLFLPEMLRRNSGRILNVASTAGFQPGPFMSVYYASKAFVISFSEAVAEEVRGTGVTVTVLCPGPTRTDFQRRAGIEKAAIAKDFLMQDAATVAQAAFAGMMEGKTIVVPGIANKCGVILSKFSARGPVRRLVGRLNKEV